MLKEFRDFINRGNVLDLAVAVIIGAAFGAIVNSLVNDVLMPLVGMLSGGLDFTSLSLKAGQASVGYGKFIQAVVNFLIIAFVIFLLVRSMNKLTRKKTAAPAPSNQEILLAEIRDLLKSRRPGA